jgi:uncharacterized protein YcfJ
MFGKKKPEKKKVKLHKLILGAVIGAAVGSVIGGTIKEKKKK